MSSTRPRPPVIVTANGCVASTPARTRCSASQAASPSAPPKPLMRTFLDQRGGEPRLPSPEDQHPAGHLRRPCMLTA
jgi:hypothetical protein